MTALRSSPARGLALPLETLVFAVGMSTLGAEIAAQRLMAPFFGSSTVIWANTIAVVLLALSVGYWLGGRLADRRPTADALNGLVVLGGARCWRSCRSSRTRSCLVSVSAFDSLSVGAFTASLFGTLVWWRCRCLLLGAVSPWAMRLKLASVEESGVVAGRLYAISTVGSLVGVFFVSLWAIEAIGTQRTFLVLAAVPALVSAARLGGGAGCRAGGAAGRARAAAGDDQARRERRVLYEKETPYQYARVVQEPDGTRKLELNEGQAIHSLWRPGTVLTGGYWDGYLVLPFVTANREPPGRIAVLGTRAEPSRGRTRSCSLDPRRRRGHRPGAVQDRAALLRVEAAAAAARVRAGRPAVPARAKDRYDSIFVDAYRQPYIPFYLTTREFFTLVRDRLRPGGSVIINVGHPADSDALEKALSATLGKVFAHVARDPIEAENSLVIASDVR